MADPRVWTFFYGSFINLEVLHAVGCRPGEHEIARLPGYALTIQPLANLVRSNRDDAWGIIASTTHDELDRLYGHAEKVLGGRYLPEAVLVETADRRWLPALCYLAPALNPAPASADYVERIAAPARQLGLPDWYCAHIESFRP